MNPAIKVARRNQGATERSDRNMPGILLPFALSSGDICSGKFGIRIFTD